MHFILPSASMLTFKWKSLILIDTAKWDFVNVREFSIIDFQLSSAPLVTGCKFEFLDIGCDSWDERCEWLITDFPLLLAAAAFLKDYL